MTKKELKQIENERKEKCRLRYRLVDDVDAYEKDINAYTRVCDINGEKMTDEIHQTILDRYPLLKEYGYTILNARDDISWLCIHAIRQIYQTERRYKVYSSTSISFDGGLDSLDLVLNPESTKIEDLVATIKYARIFGYERLVFASSSMETLTLLVEMGCKVIGPKRRNDDYGLLLDITSTNIAFFLAGKAEIEKRCRVEHDAAWGRVTPKEELDKINAKYKALADFVSA